MIILKLFLLFVFHRSFLFSQDNFLNNYRNLLNSIKCCVTDSPPTCFISRATDDKGTEKAQSFVIGSLISAGLHVILDEPRVNFSGKILFVSKNLEPGKTISSFVNIINEANFVVLFNTKQYFLRSKSLDLDAGVTQEIEHVIRRMRKDNSFLVSLLLEGNKDSSVPIKMSDILLRVFT